MAILTRSAILAAVESGDIAVTPFRPEMVGPNSIDLFVSPALKRWAEGRPLSMTTAREDASLWVDVLPYSLTGESLLIPGVLYLGTTVEKTFTPKHVPYVDGRSSLGRLGISVHCTAGRGDVGFRGAWTLEIHVAQPVYVRFDVPWCQLTLHTAEGDLSEYSGRYQGQGGATPSRISE